MRRLPSPAAEPARFSTRTARGDRDGHRRDVLSAASAILHESGWEGFSIRSIAARAGVSTGAVYQWFSGKDEILGELYDREVRGGLTLLDTVPDDVSIHELVRMLVDWAVHLYDKIGRYDVAFGRARLGSERREVTPEMERTYSRLGDRVNEMLDRAAVAESLVLVENEHRLTWFWAGCVGTAERLTVFPQSFSDEKREELLKFAAESLTRSLISR